MVQMDHISIKSAAWSKRCPTIFLLDVLGETLGKLTYIGIFKYLARISDGSNINFPIVLSASSVNIYQHIGLSFNTLITN